MPYASEPVQRDFSSIVTYGIHSGVGDNLSLAVLVFLSLKLDEVKIVGKVADSAQPLAGQRETGGPPIFGQC